ncbi:hypothetical protein T12_9122, partial [Trichinella patagoniensis]
LKVAVPLAPDCFHSDCSTNNDIIDLVVFIQFYYELKITFVLCILKMRRWNLLSVKADSKTIGVLDIGRIRLRHQLSFYGVPFALGNVISHVHIISF